jgi:hypothetical protein
MTFVISLLLIGRGLRRHCGALTTTLWRIEEPCHGTHDDPTG